MPKLPNSTRSAGVDPQCQDARSKGKGKRSLAATIQMKSCQAEFGMPSAISLVVHVQVVWLCSVPYIGFVPPVATVTMPHGPRTADSIPAATYHRSRPVLTLVHKRAWVLVLVALDIRHEKPRKRPEQREAVSFAVSCSRKGLTEDLAGSRRCDHHITCKLGSLARLNRVYCGCLTTFRLAVRHVSLYRPKAGSPFRREACYVSLPAVLR